MSHQRVKNVMSTDVATVHEGAPFTDVVRTLVLRDVGAVPVVNRDGRVVGVVSEADLLIKQGTQVVPVPADMVDECRVRGRCAARNLLRHDRRIMRAPL